MGRRKRHARTTVGLTAVVASCLLSVAAAGAAPRATITLSLLANNVGQPGYQVLVANFERVYPNIKIEATYAASTNALYQLERTQLAAGNAPDLFVVYPGCGTPISVCTLAKAGYLAPMVKTPWVKRSVRLATSFDKYGPNLVAFTPIASLYGVFTNDDLFKRLKLKLPETFPQLLALCRQAKAAGTVAIMLAGNSPTDISSLVTGMAVPLVYAKDKQFLAKQKTGSATFAASPGWRQTLQELADMNAAGCFEAGAAGVTGAAAATQFAQGQALMLPAITNMKGLIDAGSPRFTYSHHLFPGGASTRDVRTYLHLSLSLAVNAHSSVEEQRAAQTFVDFFARPKQNALFAEIQGGMTQYQFRQRQLPDYMSSEASVVVKSAYVISPVETWWNADVLLQMQQNQIGVITGQRSVDDVLRAMDTGWKRGPD
jgi:raffinose/stachyose/melibiose transport system substrate-binding protein